MGNAFAGKLSIQRVCNKNGECYYKLERQDRINFNNNNNNNNNNSNNLQFNNLNQYNVQY
jgi:hypothetical protein